jgi:hypothetical protein
MVRLCGYLSATEVLFAMLHARPSFQQIALYLGIAKLMLAVLLTMLQQEIVKT